MRKFEDDLRRFFRCHRNVGDETHGLLDRGTDSMQTMQTRKRVIPRYLLRTEGIFVASLVLIATLRFETTTVNILSL